MQITIIALTDDRAGNNSQVLGVAEKLGQPYDNIILNYNVLARLPSLIIGASLTHLSGASKALLREKMLSLRNTSPEGSVVVLSAGRRAALVARWIKKQIPSAFICSIMGTDGGEDEFNLIALPEHDRKPDIAHAQIQPASNIFYTLTSPHAHSLKTLNQAANTWRKQLEGKPRPWIAILVGGASRHVAFSEQDYARFSESIASFRNSTGGTLMVTTSRRTSPEGEKLLKQYLFSGDLYYSYREHASKIHDNPYLGFLGLADIVVVTGDSVSMCSEALSTQKPVYVYSSLGREHPKFARFREALFSLGVARPFHPPFDAAWVPSQMPDAASTIADAIKKAFKAEILI